MKPVWTTEQIVAQLTNWEARWNNQAPIAYTFLTQPYGYLGSSPNFSVFSFAQRAALTRHMELISDVANLSFMQVPDNGQAGGPLNRRIGFYNVNHSAVPYWGVAKDYSTEHEETPNGEIYGVNSAVNLYRANQQGGWTIGESNPRKLMHELLHTLGLDHPGPYNGDSADYESQALFYQDSHQYTVMSYWLADVTGADHVADGVAWFASTPLLYDVASLQYLYGANMTTRTGNTVYGFNSTAGREVFDLALHPNSVFTIWDAGGHDTLDLSGFSLPSVIDLHAGAFSDTGQMTDNISIALGARIENAIGGAGNDILIANESQNWLSGGGGSDVFTFTERDAQIGWMRSDGRKSLPDTIADFTSGLDRIDLSAIDAVRGTGANDAFNWIGAAAFSNQAGQLRAVNAGGQMRLEGDTDGNGVADLILMVAGPVILAGDFLL
jgi:serralysin